MPQGLTIRLVEALEAKDRRVIKNLRIIEALWREAALMLVNTKTRSIDLLIEQYNSGSHEWRHFENFIRALGMLAKRLPRETPETIIKLYISRKKEKAKDGPINGQILDNLNHRSLRDWLDKLKSEGAMSAHMS